MSSNTTYKRTSCSKVCTDISSYLLRCEWRKAGKSGIESHNVKHLSSEGHDHFTFLVCFWEKSFDQAADVPCRHLWPLLATTGPWIAERAQSPVVKYPRVAASASRASWNFHAEFLAFVHHLHQSDVQTCNIVICGNAGSFLLCWYCDHGIVLQIQNPDHHPAAHVHVYRSCNGKGAHCERDTNL
jgi:hypothetical protein